MVDVLTPAQRQLNMSRIRGRDTKPEMLIRRGLHARGFRYRLHVRTLSGSPDLVFPKYHAVIFVHGCFWHSHRCDLSKVPRTRPEFWKRKLARNAERDRTSIQSLKAAGWRVLIVWECALRGRQRFEADHLIGTIARYVRSSSSTFLELGCSSAL